MGTVIKFGFDDNIDRALYNEQFCKLPAHEISVKQNYKIPIVFVQMDDDISYDNIHISALKNENNEFIKNVVAFGETTFSLGRNIQRIQLPLTLAFARTVHSAQGITAKQSLVFAPTPPNQRIFTPFLAYVAVSRVGALINLLLLENLTQKHFLINIDLRVAIEKEYARLRNLTNLW